MPGGDPQRVWFLEMIEHLRARWREGITFEEMVELRNELDAMLQRIRHDGKIKSPIFKCPSCKHIGPGADPHVSVRAMILSTARFHIAASEKTYPLEKGWAAYRKQHDLDIYGVRTVAGAVPAKCGHGLRA